MKCVYASLLKVIDKNAFMRLLLTLVLCSQASEAIAQKILEFIKFDI